MPPRSSQSKADTLAMAAERGNSTVVSGCTECSRSQSQLPSAIPRVEEKLAPWCPMFVLLSDSSTIWRYWPCGSVHISKDGISVHFRIHGVFYYVCNIILMMPIRSSPVTLSAILPGTRAGSGYVCLHTQHHVTWASAYLAEYYHLFT